MSDYEDIIHLPHHVSKTRAPMSMIDRGAQFSPFAALTGYEAVLAESKRLTDQDIYLTEGSIAALDEILQDMRDRISENPWADYTCFLPDERKKGGTCVHFTGCLKKYDSVERQLILTDGTVIEIEQIVAIQTDRNL